MKQQQSEDPPPPGVVARLTGAGRFPTEIAVRGSHFFADEPA